MAFPGLGRLLGFPARRNDPIELDDPHPVPRYEDEVFTGSVAHDGYERLSIADPNRAGNPPAVKGTVGPVPRGPDDSFEQ